MSGNTPAEAAANVTPVMTNLLAARETEARLIAEAKAKLVKEEDDALSAAAAALAALRAPAPPAGGDTGGDAGGDDDNETKTTGRKPAGSKAG